MNVVEGFRIGRKCEAAQVASWKYVGQSLALLSIQQFKSPSTFSALLYFIEQQPTVRRDANGFDCSVWSSTPQRRIDEYLVRSVDPFTYEYRRLFLSRRTLSEEVPSASLLKQVVGLNVE